MQLTKEQIEALELTPEQLAKLNKPSNVPQMPGAGGYFCYKKTNGYITLFMLKDGDWRPVEQNELMRIATSM
ncbi:TPA: hypothetical protein ACMD15_003405 [Vibrio cholerae]